MVTTEPVEVVLLHPLPFDGAIWRPIEADLDPVVVNTPTIYALGESLHGVAGAVLDLVTGRRLIVVGNSIGGSVALEMAAAAPNRVEHLVLIGTKAGHRPEPDYRDRALRLLATNGIGALWEEIWEPLFAPAADRSVVAAARGEALAMPADAIASGIALFHGRRDLTDVVDHWPKPLTVITGDHDSAPGRHISQDLADRAPLGVLEVVPNCGHYVPIERPDAIARALDAAIERAR